MWGDIREGYAMLSLKAIKNINYFLRKGLGYSDAVMLAKLPDILGHKLWLSRADEYLPQILHVFDNIKQENKKHKIICDITNRLIANYKSLGISTGMFAYKDYNYVLDESDKKDVQNAVVQHLGERAWAKKTSKEQYEILSQVEGFYQSFFSDTKRGYVHTPKLSDRFKDALITILGDEFDLGKLYHHSALSKYSVQYAENTSQRLLGTPNIGAIKNPVALRTLQIIRKKVNALITNNIIDPDDTRVVVETTRDFNDANMRWAIKEYQKTREDEHKEIIGVLQELFLDRDFSDKVLDKARFFFEQRADYDKIYGDNRYVKDFKKYKLWREQGCMCMYTGRIISLAELFDENDRIEIEHTIPRSISFDNSLSNLTVCDAHYNRVIKKNLLPTQLPNYDKDVVINGREYKSIQPRLKKWENLVERLKDNVSAWKARSRKAIDKSRKDQCIRQMHLWQMELDYWDAKLLHFKQIEVTDGFRNRQLVDTGLITRHTAIYIYLKSLFHNVEVQKGKVTALFRKIFGIQQDDEKKDRDLLSHHAIDAMMLTLIPVAAKRERMLKLFFLKEEALGYEKEYYANELYKEIADCHIGGIDKVVKLIESQLLVNYHSSDKTLVPSKKIIRKRGRLVLFKHKDGSVHPHVSTGDSIRGALHKESFFGAIKYPLKDEMGFPKTEDGYFVYDTNDPMIVMKVPVKDIKEKDISKVIVDPYIKRSICITIEKRMANGQTYKEAINGDFWMLDNDGSEIRFDKTGRMLCPIRHVRCYIKTGQGYMTYKTSLPIREHLYSSTKKLVNITDRSYKKHVYAQNDDNYLFLLYEGVKRGRIARKSKILNYYEVSILRQEKTQGETYKIRCVEDLINEPYYNRIEEQGVVYNLSAIIKRKTRLLAWEESPKELEELSANELSKRLYVVVKFNNVGSDRLYLKSHIKGTEDYDLSTGVVRGFKYMIEGRDFEVDDLGIIHFNE